jgi:hypothetical protein
MSTPSGNAEHAERYFAMIAAMLKAMFSQRMQLNASAEVKIAFGNARF